MKESLKRFAPVLLPLAVAALPLIAKLTIVLVGSHVGATGYEIPVDDSPL